MEKTIKVTIEHRDGEVQVIEAEGLVLSAIAEQSETTFDSNDVLAGVSTNDALNLVAGLMASIILSPLTDAPAPVAQQLAMNVLAQLMDVVTDHINHRLEAQLSEV